MKFLIVANAPTVQTGYGVQCAHLATWLKKQGHEVGVACTFGHQVGVRNWPTPDGPVVLYPSGVLENSVDIIAGHAGHMFGGDPKAGWIIVINDVWAFGNAGLENWQVIAWTPVDHYPAPDGVVRFFHKTGALPVAMSRFGETMLFESGLDPSYAPLAVNTDVYRPTFTVRLGEKVENSRTMLGVPQDAFVVGMVAMNKDPQDRKGFNEAFRAFGFFWKQHQNAVLLVHSDRYGIFGSGINLIELAKHCAIPPHALVFTDSYAHRIGFSDEMMAGLYTACDVLICPSKGEGFGVPMIEAQACGTPVIATNFTAQTELVGPGWLVGGQLEWDASQGASYMKVFHSDLLDKLEQAYASDLPDISERCVEFAQQYAVDRVFDEHWGPIIAALEPHTPVADKPLMESVDILVPIMRDENEERFTASLKRSEWESVSGGYYDGQPDRTYAQNVNALCLKGRSDWILVVGDDVEFTPGWFEAAQKLSDRYDVIGTNDSEPGRVRNPDVAKGNHADHFFIRRSYIDELGASLEGPGVVASEAYGHWFTDKEIIELAKARGVFGFAEDCRIIHHHPGFDGDEDAREADPIYMRAVDSAEKDRRTWMSRLPLIQALRVKR